MFFVCRPENHLIMKTCLHSRDGALKGAALIIVLAFVVLLTVLVVAYFSRTTTDRQLAQSSFNDTAADLLARSGLDITVSDLKQEIINNPTVTTANIQPSRYGAPLITDPTPIPNLIRRSFSGAPQSRASNVSSGAASANGRSISLARWNSHYLIPRASGTLTIDSTPVSSFIAPDWVLVTGQGPNSAAAPNAVIGRYAFAVYDEGGLIDMNVGGFPTYASLTRPTRRFRPKHPLEENEIILVAGQAPSFTPTSQNASAGTGASFSFTPNTNHNPSSFTSNPILLPRGLSLNMSTGTISGIPTSPGKFTIQMTAYNSNGAGNGTVILTITGLISPDSTPWPVNLARKGPVAFADLTALPATPPLVTPTTTAGIMSGFLSTSSIGKLIGWRNHATTGQTSASFDTPLFPLASADNYAKYFLGPAAPFTTSYTTVSTVVTGSGRTDQAVMNRQELLKLRRTIGFSQSLLQYLGTFARETNRPAPDWPKVSGINLTARFDINNLGVVIPDSWIKPGNGQGHAYGKQKHSDLGTLFGLVWVPGTFQAATRFTDPNYYGHWKYIHTVTQLPATPDFFQVLYYAMNRTSVSSLSNTFTVGAALIDQYDTDDLQDPDPNLGGGGNGSDGNPITIIDPVGNANPADYVYGMEGMSFDNPNPSNPQNDNLARPPFAPTPPPNYVLLNRRFENVGEFGYAYNPSSTTMSKTLDFASSTSPNAAILDFFTYNTASRRAGVVDLNTRNGPVLASIIRGALLSDPGAEITPTVLVSRTDALSAGQAIVRETTNNGLAVTRRDVARLAAAGAAAVPALAGSDEKKQTIARALAEAGQTRTWNLMIDVIAQTGKYAPGTADITDPTKFTVQGEKRYWLHIALDRDSGTVLGQQLEQVTE